MGWPWCLTPLVLVVLVGCVEPPTTARSEESTTGEVDPAVVAAVADQRPRNGRFRSTTETGVVGQVVVETVVTGAFDEEAGAFEASIDLDRMLATASPGMLTGEVPVEGGELVIRGAADLVFVKADDRGWILLPGTVDEVLQSAGVVRPDALLDLLDAVADSVVEAPGERIDGEFTTRYSGWIPTSAFDDLMIDGAGGDVALGPLVGVADAVESYELLDRLIRFDVWVDAEGRARRLVLEADLEAITEVALRIDGHADGIDRLRLRHEVDWFDLGLVSIEPPPRSEVSVIDFDALDGAMYE